MFEVGARRPNPFPPRQEVEMEKPGREINASAARCETEQDRFTKTGRFAMPPTNILPYFTTADASDALTPMPSRGRRFFPSPPHLARCESPPFGSTCVVLNLIGAPKQTARCSDSEMTLARTSRTLRSARARARTHQLPFPFPRNDI